MAATSGWAFPWRRRTRPSAHLQVVGHVTGGRSPPSTMFMMVPATGVHGQSPGVDAGPFRPAGSVGACGPDPARIALAASPGAVGRSRAARAGVVAQQDVFILQDVPSGAVCRHGLEGFMSLDPVMPLRQFEVVRCQHSVIRTHVRLERLNSGGVVSVRGVCYTNWADAQQAGE